MAPAATNGDSPAAVLDDIKPPSGVILPPRDIRGFLEKTAGYVARNGMAFEDRIREKERSNPKFSFLDPEDAYHEYYTWRLYEVKNGRGTAIAAGRDKESADAAEKPKGPPPPPEYKFSARMPRINQKDLDVLRLTALFVAKAGRPFQTQLAQREAGSPQFQFLIPTHTFHNYFQHLVDQYTTLLRAGGLAGDGGKLQDERIAELQENIDNKYHILDRARRRADYAKFQEREKQHKEEAEEQAKIEFASIDWNDFVVVETIVFTDSDEQANLPPPTTLSDIQYASLEDRKQVSVNMRIEEAMPGEEDGGFNDYQPQPSYALPVHSGYGVQPAQPPPPPTRTAEEEEEERRIQERIEARERVQQAQAQAQAQFLGGAASMKIRDNYVPRAAQRAGNRTGQLAICPNCKQQFPVDELPEHMRIEMLDPRWREQKAKSEARYETTNLTSVDVASNLKRLASQRSDVFDSVTGQPITDEDASRRKRPAAAAAGTHGDGIGLAHVPPDVVKPLNVGDQIARIHEKFAKKAG